MKKKLNIFLSMLLLTAFLSGCQNNSKSPVIAPVDTLPSETPTEAITETEPETEPVVEIDPITINLISVGDMLMHRGANIPADKGNGVYNYDYLFANVADAIACADLAIANNEVIMAGNTLGEYGDGNIGYPCFNVRTELGDAEVSAGFDVILGATNHTMDQDTIGIFNTVNYWKANHPDTTLLGIYDSAEDAAKIAVKDVNGIKIAMLNYTYGLNGATVPEQYSFAVNLMNQYTKDKIAADIKRAKDLADFVVVFPHWGIEYQFTASEEQQEWANFFAEEGVDLVIGTHPHVVQPVEWITASNGHKMLVYYSLGNFVSIQYYNYSMLGGMAKVAITKDSTGAHISSYDMDFLVTHFVPGRSVVTTFYLDNYTDELAAQHGILTEPAEGFMEVNKNYPFTVEGLKNLAKTICPDLAKY